MLEHDKTPSDEKQIDDRILRQEMAVKDVILPVGHKGVGRIQPNCNTPNSSMWLFEKSGEILLFTSRNEKVSRFVYLMTSMMHLVSFILVTGARTRLIWEAYLGTEGVRGFQANNLSVSKHVTGQRVSVVGTITLHVRIRDSKVKVDFGIVRSLAVQVFTGTSFHHSFVGRFFHTSQYMVPYDCWHIPILAINDMPETHKDIARDAVVLKEDTARLVHVVRQRKIPPRSEKIVLVATETRVLVQIGPLL